MKKRAKATERDYGVGTKRPPGWYAADNELMTVFAPVIGIYALGVWNLLKQRAFLKPEERAISQRGIAAGLAISTEAARAALRTLKDFELIEEVPAEGVNDPSTYLVVEAKDVLAAHPDIPQNPQEWAKFRSRRKVVRGRNFAHEVGEITCTSDKHFAHERAKFRPPNKEEDFKEKEKNKDKNPPTPLHRGVEINQEEREYAKANGGSREAAVHQDASAGAGEFGDGAAGDEENPSTTAGGGAGGSGVGGGSGYGRGGVAVPAVSAELRAGSGQALTGRDEWQDDFEALSIESDALLDQVREEDKNCETEDAAAVADGVVRGGAGVVPTGARRSDGATTPVAEENVQYSGESQAETLEARRKRAMAAMVMPGMSSVGEMLGGFAAMLTDDDPAETSTQGVERNPDPRQMGNWFLQYLHDLFPIGFGSGMARNKGGNWEDPYVAWTRCFAHVSVGEVEMDDDRWVVTLETPRPKDLASGLQKYSAKVQQAMVKAFGREVQIVPRLEAA